MLVESVLLFAEIALRHSLKVPEFGGTDGMLTHAKISTTHVSYLDNPLLLGRNSKMPGSPAG